MQMERDSTSNADKDNHPFDEDQDGEEEHEQEGEANLMAVAEPDLHERGTVPVVTSARKSKDKKKK